MSKVYRLVLITAMIMAFMIPQGAKAQGGIVVGVDPGLYRSDIR